MDIGMNQSPADAFVGKCNVPVRLHTASAGEMGKWKDFEQWKCDVDDRWLQICSSFVAVLVCIGQALVGDLKKWSSDRRVHGQERQQQLAWWIWSKGRASGAQVAGGVNAGSSRKAWEHRVQHSLFFLGCIPTGLLGLPCQLLSSLNNGQVNFRTGPQSQWVRSASSFHSQRLRFQRSGVIVSAKVICPVRMLVSRG